MRFGSFHIQAEGGSGPESMVPEMFDPISVVDTAFGPRRGRDEGENGEFKIFMKCFGIVAPSVATLIEVPGHSSV